MSNRQQRSEMKKCVKMVLWLWLCLSLMLSSCTVNTAKEEVPQQTEVPEIMMVLPEEIVHINDLVLGAGKISGTVKEETLNWADQSIHQYAAMLVDATPFLTMQADLSDVKVYETSSLDNDGSYSFDLPQQPAADNGMLVMILTVEDQDCLIPGNQLFYCWDVELSSIAFEDASQSKVIDGQLLIWAADDGQSFPESIGADDLFFTDDDNLKSLEPGYTLIDLGAKPFTFDHQGELDMALYSNYDPSIRDLSELTYTEAFERIFNDMREGYAFNGVEGKEPDWDAVYELIYPQVEAAEKSSDVNDWISILNAYTQQFSDSHVSISGDVVDEWVEEKYSHGYIYYFDLLSDGNMIYTRGTTSNIEYERFAYYHIGHKLAEIYKTPIDEMMDDFMPIIGSYSNPEMLYRAKVRDIPHVFSEKGFKFGFANFKGYISVDMYKFADEYTITAEDDYVIAYDPTTPISGNWAYSDIGILNVHSDGHDMQTTLELFEESLARFDDLHVNTLIIDLRDSEETRFMNYAGYFTEDPIELGEMEWNQFGESGAKLRNRQLVSIPSINQYSFDKIAVLTGERCKDACEVDVYALGQLPQTTIYGETSTFGSYAIVNPTTYTLPDQVLFNYSTGFTRDENGDFLIEGVGVPVDTTIEERLSTYLHNYDWRLSLLIDMLAYEEELGVIPQSNPVPMELNDDEIDDLIHEIGQRDIEYLSVDEYPVLFMPLNYTYRVFIEDPGKLFVSEKWCTDDPDLYINKGEHMTIEFIVDGATVDESFHHTTIIQKNGYKCWVKYVVLDQWVPGTHHVEISSEYLHQYFFDGSHSYDQGKYIEEYTVVVKESE